MKGSIPNLKMKSVLAILEGDGKGRLWKDFCVARESLNDIFVLDENICLKRKGFNNVNMNMGIYCFTCG